MSNQACLFAEDTPAPYDPFSEETDQAANTLQIAGAADQVPAFWLFCFGKGNIVEVESEEGKIPALVSAMSEVRNRLATRDELARDLFPSHATAWEEFRQVVESADRKYLKVDAYEIWVLSEDEREFGRQLKKALNWFDSAKKADLNALLSLAGIVGYDVKTKSFPADEDDEPERFLYGWFEE
jgi:hypothetical protein